MNDAKLCTVADVRAFAEAAQDCVLRVPRGKRYAFVAATLTRFGYARQRRADKGAVLRYLERWTGRSRQQLTRPVKRFVQGALTRRRAPPKMGFARRFNAEDVALLAYTDALHSQLSGPAIKKIMERAHARGAARYARLATSSVAYLYNLRASTD